MRRNNEVELDDIGRRMIRRNMDEQEKNTWLVVASVRNGQGLEFIEIT